MDKSLLIIIYSFNRALQLDCLLRSIFTRIKIVNYKIAVIFDCDERHKESYEKIKEKYANKIELRFYKTSTDTSFIRNKLPYLFNARNFARFIKHRHLRKIGDNFKMLNEEIIKYSGMRFLMFLTDDGYFFKDVEIPDKIFEIIRNNPEQSSYRMYIGDNLSDFPYSIKKTIYGYNWNYMDEKYSGHWAYPFAIDATIYYSQSLLNIIKPVLYNMPVSFESYVCHRCKVKNYFTDGWSPIKSVYVGISLNRVASINKGLAGNINPDLLKEYFVSEYIMSYDFEIPPIRSGMLPNKIILENKDGVKKIIEMKSQYQSIQ